MTSNPSPTMAPALRHTRWFLLAFYALAVLFGVGNALTREPGATGLILSLCLAVSMGWWAITDSKRHNHPIPMSARMWFVLLAWIVVPIYVVWSRRWRGVGWVLVNGVCWYLVVAVVMNVVGLSVFGDDWGR
jgi:hypothetical protein